MTIGTPPKNIRLMPAFHTHRTFITASDCIRCKQKAFDPKESSTDEPGTPGPLVNLEFIFDHYGKQSNGFLVTGEAMKDFMCIRHVDSTSKNETIECASNLSRHEFLSVWDFKHDQNISYFDEMPYDGILGLGPFTNELEEKHSFIRYLFRMDQITNHTLQFRHSLSGGSKQLEFGAFGHQSARVRYHIE